MSIPGTGSRLRRRLRRANEVALPALVALAQAGQVLAGADGGTGLTVVGMVAAVGSGLALRWRRAHPERVMAAALLGGLVIQLSTPYGVVPPAGLVALGSLAGRRPDWLSLPATVALLAVTALAFRRPGLDVALVALSFPVLAWAIGEIARHRTRATQQTARAQMLAEQARVARELHDVLAQSVSAIVMRAAAADAGFDRDPDSARSALRSIEGTGKEALAELRALLPPLHGAGSAHDPDQHPHHPHRRGLDRIDDLIEPMAAAGVDVVVRRDGVTRLEVAPEVDACAYRIVQEALANTVRHAGARHAQVTLRVGVGMLEVEIRDDGRGAPVTGPVNGPGIAGMRARAPLLGGSLEAGPGADGGFEVHAWLPVEGRR